MLRSVIALIAGFAIMTFTVLVSTIIAMVLMKLPPGEPTREYLLINLVYSTAAAAFGGYSTATLAPDRPSAHVVILALMVAVMGISNYVLPQEWHARWYLLAAIVLGPAGALGGGWLRAAQVRRRATPEVTP